MNLESKSINITKTDIAQILFVKLLKLNFSNMMYWLEKSSYFYEKQKGCFYPSDYTEISTSLSNMDTYPEVYISIQLINFTVNQLINYKHESLSNQVF